MGLDMFLTGEIYIPTDWNSPENNHYEDGYRLKARLYELGYWRKHPDLHGFIVENFADEGIDDCKPIYLGTDNMQTVITAIRKDQLPNTEGFFFGESLNNPEEKAHAIEIFSKAIKWLEEDPWRSVYYRASW